MKRNHGQNNGACKCDKCGAEAHSTRGGRHRKCKAAVRGYWREPPEKPKAIEGAAS